MMINFRKFLVLIILIGSQLTVVGVHAIASIDVSPTKGEFGSVIKVSGSGFNPGGELFFYLGDYLVRSGVVPSTEGYFSTVCTVPNIISGPYQLIVTQPSAEKVVSTQFEVVERWTWPMFRYNARHTGQSPVIGSHENTTQWCYSTGEIIWDSPAIGSDGTIYIGGFNNEVDAITPKGTEKWRHQIGAYVAGTPVVGPDGTIYVSCNDYYVYSAYKLLALTPGGSEKWSFITKGWIESPPTIGSDGTIYVGCMDATGEQALFAIYPNGTEKWSYAEIGGIRSSPAIGLDGTIYVEGDDQYLYAIDPNGTLKWSTYIYVGDTSHSPVVGSDGTIYIGHNSYLYAINPNSTQKWSSLIKPDQLFTFTMGPDDAIYVGCNDYNLYLVNATTGSSKSVYEAGGSIDSLAIGVNGTIYAGSWDNNLYSINPEGTKRWCFVTGDSIGSTPRVKSNATSETIYVLSSDGCLYAIDRFGEMLWYYVIGNSVESSPSIGLDGTIYIGSVDHKFYAINPDGTPKWFHETSGVVRSSAAIGSDGTVYVVSDDGRLYALSDTQGGFVWSPPEIYVVDSRSSPAIGRDGTIYVVGGAGGSVGAIYAINPRNGATLWSCPFGMATWSSPAIGLDGTIYVGGDPDKLNAIDPVTHSVKWECTLGSWVQSSPAIGIDGTIYVGSSNGNLYAVKPDGNINWSYTIVGGISSSPAIGSDGTIYVGSWNGSLCAINPPLVPGGIAVQKWRYNMGSSIMSSPAIGADGVVYVGCNDDKLYAINGTNGMLIWSYLTGGDVISSPAIGSDGTIYVGSNDRNVYAIRGRKGEMLQIEDPNNPTPELLVPTENYKPMPVQAAIASNVVGGPEVELVKNKNTSILVRLPPKPNTIVSVSVTFNGVTNTLQGSAVNVKDVLTFYPYIPTATGIKQISGSYIDGVGPHQLTTVDVNVIETAGPLVAYYSIISPPGNKEKYQRVSEDSYTDTATNSTAFMNATYPVAGLTSDIDDYTNNWVTGNEYYSKIPTQALRKDCLLIQDAAANKWSGVTSVKGVGIVTQSYLNYHRISKAAGYMYPGVLGGVIVLEGYCTGAAHEVGHTYGLYQTAEQYELTAPADGLASNGVWVSRKAWTEGTCFMGKGASGYSGINTTWVSTNSQGTGVYETLAKTLKPVNDPEVLIVNGIIYKNGTITFDNPWDVLPVGTPDLIPSGEYTLRFIDKEGNKNDTTFNAPWYMYIEPQEDTSGYHGELGVVPIDEAPFAFVVEYPPDTSEILILGKNGELMKQVNVPATLSPIKGEPTEYQLDLSATFTDTDSTVHTASWDWGDGSSSNGVVIEESGTVQGTHTYDDTGTYKVALILSDGEATTTAYKSVKVIEVTHVLVVEVRDPLGFAVPSAEVEISSSGQIVATGYTDTSGIFSASELVSGEYKVQIKHMGFVASSEIILTKDDRLLIHTPVSIILILIILACIALLLIIYILHRRRKHAHVHRNMEEP